MTGAPARALAARALVALAAFAGAGCASTIGFGRATTLEPARGQVSGVGQFDVIAPKIREDGKAVALPWVHVGIGYHRGVARGVELGGRGWIFGVPGHLSFGFAADGKVALVRSTPGRGLQVATGASVAYHQAQLGGTPWHLFTGWVPILFGHDFGPHQFVIGPRAGYTLWTGEGQNPVKLPWFGGGAGVSFGVGSRTQIMPELVLLYSPVSFNGEVDDERRGAYVLQLGLSASYEP